MSYQTSFIDLTNPIFIIYSLTHILTIISIQIEDVEDAANLPGSCNIRRRPIRPILSQTRHHTVTQSVPVPPPPPRIRAPATHTVTSAMLRNNDRPVAASTPLSELDDFTHRGPDGQPLVRAGTNDGVNIIYDPNSRRPRPRQNTPRSPTPHNGNHNTTFVSKII